MEIEQKFYDYLTIAIKKYKMPMTFPADIMIKHVKDKDALSKFETPLKFIGYNTYIPKEVDIFDILKEAGCMQGEKAYLDVVKEEQKKFYTETLSVIHHSAMKEIDSMEEREIDSMNDIIR